MRYVLMVAAVLFVIGYLFVRKSEVQEKRERVGLAKNEKTNETYVQKIKDFANSKAAYTDTNIHNLTLASLALMIPGAIAGILLKNTEVGLLLSIALSLIPFFHMMWKEQKKQILILQQIVPYLSRMDWSYTKNSFNITETLVDIKSACPSMIREDYQKMLKKINAKMPPYQAMYEFAEVTRCSIFKVLSGILAAQQQRNDPKAFKDALKKLINNIVKTNNRLQKVKNQLSKKGVMLAMAVGVTIGIYWMCFAILSDPIGYFRSAQGKTAMLVGCIALIIPVSIFAMSALRKRF